MGGRGLNPSLPYYEKGHAYAGSNPVPPIDLLRLAQWVLAILLPVHSFMNMLAQHSQSAILCLCQTSSIFGAFFVKVNIHYTTEGALLIGRFYVISNLWGILVTHY